MVPQDFKANGVKVSLNDLIIKAAATTLQLVPEVNINVVGEAEYRILPNVDISVAVATPNGLITPIVTNAIGKTLPEISSSVRDLALRARDGKLQLNEFQVILNFALLNEVKAIALSSGEILCAIYCKRFMNVVKTIANSTIYCRKPGDCNGTIIFEIDVMKNSSQLNLKFTIFAMSKPK